MKNFFRCTFAVMTVGIMAGACSSDSATTVKICNLSGSKIYFQPESYSGYQQITPADTVISISESPVYYRFVGADGTFIPVFITPGSSTIITVDQNGNVTITGSNEKENRFMRENNYICRTPETIKTYSDEWVNYNEKAILSLDSLIDASGLNTEFATTHKLYNRLTFLNQRLGGLTLAKTFSSGDKEIIISDNFYDFLDSLKFTDSHILTVPIWFNVINNALETMEKRGLIPVDNDNYMSIYANVIDDEKVRSHYLVNLLDLTLKRNYLTDFERQYPTVKTLITDPDAIARLPELEIMFDEKTAQAANVSTGKPMPDFICRDVDGNEFKFSNFKGNYVLLDFWYTGCAPCRAEMPYFDEVAQAFDGQGVKFISLSVDTGDELYAAWEKMMREKPHIPGVLSVNLPDGFKSQLLKELNIHGVPRIMLIDPDGKIVESYAKRPSDPKLRQQLEHLTK